MLSHHRRKIFCNIQSSILMYLTTTSKITRRTKATLLLSKKGPFCLLVHFVCGINQYLLRYSRTDPSRNESRTSWNAGNAPVTTCGTAGSGDHFPLGDPNARLPRFVTNIIKRELCPYLSNTDNDLQIQRHLGKF